MRGDSGVHMTLSDPSFGSVNMNYCKISYNFLQVLLWIGLVYWSCDLLSGIERVYRN